MEKLHLETTHFDFRRARVRGSKDGKTWKIIDKFGLYWILRHIDYYEYLYADSIDTYEVMKNALLDELKRHKYQNVHFITNEKQ